MKNLLILMIVPLFVTVTTGCSSTKPIVSGAKYEVTPTIAKQDIGTIKAVEFKLIPAQIAEDETLLNNIQYYRYSETMARAKYRESLKNESFVAKMVREGVVADLISLRLGLGLNSMTSKERYSPKNFGELSLNSAGDAYRYMHFFGRVTDTCSADCIRLKLLRTMGKFNLMRNKKYNTFDVTRPLTHRELEPSDNAMRTYYADNKDYAFSPFFIRTNNTIAIGNDTFVTSAPNLRMGYYFKTKLKASSNELDLHTVFLDSIRDTTDLIFFMPVVLLESTENNIVCTGGYFAQGHRATPVGAFGCNNPHIADAPPVVWN